MRYAKLINDYPSYAPRRLRIGSAWVYNPTDEHLLAEGYLPVIALDPPETDERHYAEPHWAEENGKIVQSWEVKEIPITDEEALTRYANELTGAEDADLISATETLIQQRMED
jgi:hypothetical protein